MRYQGKITDWKDDRGFGFITPSGGGQPVFVHISAFRKGQGRPTGNELVTYELLNDPKKGFRAQNVVFFGAVFQPSVRKEGRRSLKPFIAVLLVAGIGVYAWQHLSSGGVKVLPGVESMLGAKDTTKFQCQGKRYCSEMTSCEEATFYLKNCPGVEIDGDGDGIPCESQLCGH
jgi:cold shock CspA family protein